MILALLGPEKLTERPVELLECKEIKKKNLIKKCLYLSYPLRYINSDNSYTYQRGVVPSGTGH